MPRETMVGKDLDFNTVYDDIYYTTFYDNENCKLLGFLKKKYKIKNLMKLQIKMN